MYDAITPSRVPAPHPTMVAGYVGGRWPSYGEMVARFPGAVHVSIAIAADETADVLDVERLDATPGESVGWVQRMRAAGRVPTVYCNASTMPAVRAAFADAGVGLPSLWVADYDDRAVLSGGYVAKQFATTPGYDLSIVADYWPGVDPAPRPRPIPPKPVTRVKVPAVFMIHRLSDGLVELCTGGWHLEHVESHPSYDVYLKAGVPNFDLPDHEYTAMRAAIVAAKP